MGLSTRNQQTGIIQKQAQGNALKSELRRAALIGALFSVAFNTAGQILFKAARTAQPDASLLAILFSPLTWFAFIIYGLSAIVWLWVLSRVALSFAYPILSLTFPIVVALSAIIFGEPVSLICWLGVAVIVTGVSLLART